MARENFPVHSWSFGGNGILRDEMVLGDCGRREEEDDNHGQHTSRPEGLRWDMLAVSRVHVLNGVVVSLGAS